MNKDNTSQENIPELEDIESGVLSFEQALEHLEYIVSQMEKGELTLEESLSFFEKGIRLSRYCSTKLQETEDRVKILLEDNDSGELILEDFEENIS